MPDEAAHSTTRSKGDSVLEEAHADTVPQPIEVKLDG